MKFVVVDKNGKVIESELKKRIKEKLQKGKDWFVRNKDMIVVLAPVAIGGATVLVKSVGKHVNLRKEEQVKNLFCYDRSLGHYWALRRELSNREWLEIDQRKKSGERMADILEELRVLK